MMTILAFVGAWVIVRYVWTSLERMAKNTKRPAKLFWLHDTINRK